MRGAILLSLCSWQCVCSDVCGKCGGCENSGVRYMYMDAA